MNIIVLQKMVPDLVEELEIHESGNRLDTEFLRMNISESDDHALEEALILKEKYGGTITVLTVESPEIDDILFTALAKGVDRTVKISGDWGGVYAPDIAEIYSKILSMENWKPTSDTLILTGSQAIDDLEGEIAPHLSEILKIPYLGVVSCVTVDVEQKKVTVNKEFAGGLRGEFEIPFPVILGIQAAEKPPRYVPVARIRQTMKTSKIEEFTGLNSNEIKSVSQEVGATLEDGGTSTILAHRMFKPEPTGKAQMLEGSPEEITSQIINILTEKGLL